MQKWRKTCKKKKSGKIIPNGVLLAEHENEIVVFFTELGYDVELIPRSYKKGIKTADAIIDGIEWEFKSPRGKGKWVIDNTVQKGVRQSPNLVVDLRHIKLVEAKSLRRLEEQFKRRKSLKRLRVITKRHELIDFIK